MKKLWQWQGPVLEGIYEQVIKILVPDHDRSGLAETPKRVAKAWEHWAGGYDVDPKEILKTFEDGAEGYNQMVHVRNLPFYSHCEHHLAPFFGTATIAYIPNQRIVGLSKLGRLLDAFARRLQVQERMTRQIADALQDCLEPTGVGVVITARHLCMESRGIRVQGADTVTTALRGAIMDEPQTRNEFLLLSK